MPPAPPSPSLRAFLTTGPRNPATRPRAHGQGRPCRASKPVNPCWSTTDAAVVGLSVPGQQAWVAFSGPTRLKFRAFRPEVHGSGGKGVQGPRGRRPSTRRPFGSCAERGQAGPGPFGSCPRSCSTAPEPFGSWPQVDEEGPRPFGSCPHIGQELSRPFGSCARLDEEGPAPFGSCRHLVSNAARSGPLGARPFGSCAEVGCFSAYLGPSSRTMHRSGGMHGP